MHSDILAAHSGPLRRTTEAVRDGGREEADRKIDLHEWDGDTVGRFVEFLYVGHYQAPGPTRQPSVAAAGAAGTERIAPDSDTHQHGADTPATSYSVWTGTAQSDTTETGLARTPSPGPRPLTPLGKFGLEINSDPNPNMRQEVLEMFGLREFDPAVCGYGEVLLAHAKVYSLAQNQEVEALRKLSYKHLLSVLLGIGPVEPGWRVVVDIISLLRYVYSHTVPAEGSEEPLQKIVSQFAALNFPALQNRDEMTELIREGGTLASDLMEKVCKRLVHSESILQEESKRRTEAQLLEEVEQEHTARAPPPSSSAFETANTLGSLLKETAVNRLRSAVTGDIPEPGSAQAKTTNDGNEPLFFHHFCIIVSFSTILVLLSYLLSG